MKYSFFAQFFSSHPSLSKESQVPPVDLPLIMFLPKNFFLGSYPQLNFHPYFRSNKFTSKKRAKRPQLKEGDEGYDPFDFYEDDMDSAPGESQPYGFS